MRILLNIKSKILSSSVTKGIIANAIWYGILTFAIPALLFARKLFPFLSSALNLSIKFLSWQMTVGQLLSYAIIGLIGFGLGKLLTKSQMNKKLIISIKNQSITPAQIELLNNLNPYEKEILSQFFYKNKPCLSLEQNINIQILCDKTILIAQAFGYSIRETGESFSSYCINSWALYYLQSHKELLKIPVKGMKY
jgi:hypothetical protein